MRAWADLVGPGGWTNYVKKMSKTYTQIDWASDMLARTNWANEEERLMNEIDKSMVRTRRTSKLNKKNHRNYA